MIGIIGGGASGCAAAYFLLKAGKEVTVFDYASPLRTLLPTGGGRCNLAHSEYDFKELAQNYPRGEKFLYSVFSKFSTYDTLAFFEELGIKTYTQEDGRIFPVSNSAKEVRNTFLKKLQGVNFVKEGVNEVIPYENGYQIKTDKAKYFFSNIIIATGGGLKSRKIKGLDLNIVPYTPALVGLNANIKNLSGVVVKDAYSLDYKISGDILFTHFGISGPLIYTISSFKTKEPFPYVLSFDFYKNELDFQKLLNSNPHKDLKNILSLLFPRRFAEFITGEHAEIKACEVNKHIRDLLLEKIHNFQIKVSGFNKGEETVTAGGYDLAEINQKTMEAKRFPHLYIIGEALNIDGLCGGFNLQNAWSTAFVASNAIIEE